MVASCQVSVSLVIWRFLYYHPAIGSTNKRLNQNPGQNPPNHDSSSTNPSRNGYSSRYRFSDADCKIWLSRVQQEDREVPSIDIKQDLGQIPGPIPLKL